MDVVAVIKGILGVSFLIVLHELGHYLLARIWGMRVVRFSVGFGPSLLKRRFGETEWQIAAVPLGGFVQIDGMGPAAEGDPPPDERSFRNKPVWQRLSVIAAGPVMNWLLAAIFIMVLAGTIGLNRVNDNSTAVGELLADKPAAKAGLLVGDRIVEVDGTPTETWPALVEAISRNPEREILIKLERGEERLVFAVTPMRYNDTGKIGIGRQLELIRLDPGPAVLYGFIIAWEKTAQQAGLLWGMVVGTQEGQLSGIPGIVKMVSIQAAKGIGELLQFLAWLSIGLFLLNLLPLPALDGGRLVFLLIETVRGRPVDERIEGMVHGVGFLLLLALIVAVSIRDLIP